MSDQPYMGRAEIALMLGVSRQKAYRVTMRPGFPTPRRLRMGDVWSTEDVEAWIAQHWREA